MDLSKEYFVDPNLAEDGVDVEMGTGAKITVRRMNNSRMKKRLTELRRPYERKIQRGVTDEFQEFLDGLTRQAISETVLIGWDGIKVDGKAVKYSPETAEDLMKRFPDFQEDVITAATTHETFRREAIEENEGNSETS